MSDTAILAALSRVIDRSGPNDFTLAELGAEVGLAPSTLVQRFGSRRGLLLAYARHAAERVPEILRSGEGGSDDSPLQALEAGLLALVGPVADPAVLANHLSFLLIDVTDPEFRALAARHQSRAQAEIRRLLEAAMEGGELERSDPAALARAVLTLTNGVMITWALDRAGALEDRLSEELGRLLDAHGRRGSG